MNEVAVAELGHKLIQRQPALRHSGQGLYPWGVRLGQHIASPPRRGGSHPLRLGGGEGLEQIFHRIRRRGGGQVLIAAVPQQALGQMGGGHAGAEPNKHFRLRLLPGVIQLHSVPNGISHIQGIPPLLQHPGEGGDLPQVVKAGHVGHSEGQFNCLTFPRLQQPGLLEGPQAPGGLLQLPPGGGVVELDHLFARPFPGVGHPDGPLDLPLRLPGAHRLQRKAGVGQAVAKGVAHPLRRPRKSFKIPVAHINILGVVHIVGGVVEVLRGGVVGQISDKGVGQLAAGIGLAGEQGSNGRAPFHTPLVGQEGRRDAVVLPKPGDVHHAAHVEHHSHLVKGGADLFHHGPLLLGEVVVPPGEDSLGFAGHIQLIGPGVVRLLIKDRLPVPALPGEAAEDDHGHVRIPPGRIHQALGQLRLGHQAGDVPRLIPLLHVVPVKIGQGLIEGYALFFQAVIQIFDIGRGHIPAAAAALHIVEAALAEQGHPGIGSQREQISVVFQQHRRPLRSRSAARGLSRTPGPGSGFSFFSCSTPPISVCAARRAAV